MVGKGVLYECLKDPGIESVLVVNRRHLGIEHPKLKELIHLDFNDLSAIREELTGYNACFFCLGSVALRIKEDEYRRITHDMTLHMATTLLKINPDITFNYISGLGADRTEKSRIMRMKVKGETENALLALPSNRIFMFRPGYIQPKNGIKPSVRLYLVMYTLFVPLYPLLRITFPKIVTSTDQVGKAMINVGIGGFSKEVLENRDINHLAKKLNPDR